MTTPTPEQLAKWCKEALSFYIRTPIDPNRTGHSHYYTDGYLRAKTEQASEIAALKTQVAELMPLAKFGAMVMASRLLMNHDYGTIDRAIESGLLSDEGTDGFVLRDITYTANIEATIEQLLKE